MELNEQEIRKKKIKKQRTQAIAVFVGVIAVVLLVVVVLIGGLVHVVSTKKDQQAEKELAGLTENVNESEEENPDDYLEEEDSTDVDLEEESSEETTEQENAGMDDTPDEETAAETEETESDPSQESDKIATETDDGIVSNVEDEIGGMTIEQKVACLFFLTPEQLMGREAAIDSVGSEFNAKLNEYPVGGIVVREANMKDADSVSALTSNISQMSQQRQLLAVCEEGGADSPFVKQSITENVLSSQREVGEGQGVAGAYSLGISIGSEVKQYGFNMVLSPLGDVSTMGASIVADRCFGTDIETTKELTASVVQGLSDQGVVSCVKYFPSYSDVAPARGSGQLVSQRTKEDLQKEAVIYKEALESGAEFLMISHVSLPKVRGDKRPASLSKEIITDIVRDEWGYDGVVMTDFMDQPCIYQKYTYAEAAVGAIEAGADMLLATKNFDKSYQAILTAVKDGTLTEERIDESVRRILRVRYRHNN